MREIENRIKRLRLLLSDLPALLTVHYSDGQRRTMRPADAVFEALYNKDAEKITGGGKEYGRLDEILQAVMDLCSN